MPSYHISVCSVENNLPREHILLYPTNIIQVGEFDASVVMPLLELIAHEDELAATTDAVSKFQSVNDFFQFILSCKLRALRECDRSSVIWIPQDQSVWDKALSLDTSNALVDLVVCAEILAPVADSVVVVHDGVSKMVYKFTLDDDVYCANQHLLIDYAIVFLPNSTEVDVNVDSEHPLTCALLLMGIKPSTVTVYVNNVAFREQYPYTSSHPCYLDGSLCTSEFVLINP